MHLTHRLRALPRHILIPLVVLLLVAVAVIGRGLSPTPTATNHHPAHAATTDETITAPVAPVPAASTITIQQAAIAHASSAPLRIPDDVLQPPQGVLAGRLHQVTETRDQYRRWVQLATTTVAAPTVSIHTTTGAHRDQRVVWRGWAHLDAATPLALLQVAGGDGTASATIDGKPLGDPLQHWRGDGPDRRVASVDLAKGWHQIAITSQGDTTVSLATTDGTSAPVTVVPWAVPDSADGKQPNTGTTSAGTAGADAQE